MGGTFNATSSYCKSDFAWKSRATFTDRHGHKIGDYPREPEPVEDDDDPVMEYIDNASPAIDAQDDPEIPGMEPEARSEPTNEPIVEPTGVEVDSDHQELDFNDGLG